MESTVEIIDVENANVDEDGLFVVVDTFAFSTTVTTALGNDSIGSVQTTKRSEELDKYDFPVGGESRFDSEIMNSPLVFTDRNFETDRVGLTSDNGAWRVHQLLERGAETVVLGCLRNGRSLGTRLEEDDRDTYIVPADSGEVPVIEDYLASVIISNLSRGYNYDETEVETIREKASNCMGSENSDRSRFCLEYDKTDVIPITTDGIFEVW